jgi:hypothetical protein
MGERLVEVLVVEDGTWIVIPFEKLRKGNIFKLYEDTNLEELHVDAEGNSVFVALDNAFESDGVWDIKYEAERCVR